MWMSRRLRWGIYFLWRDRAFGQARRDHQGRSSMSTPTPKAVIMDEASLTAMLDSAFCENATGWTARNYERALISMNAMAKYATNG